MYDLPPTDHSPIPVMTVDTAHRVMQQHLTCPATVCARKHQAKRRLTEAAHLVPADQPHFGG